MPRQSKPEKKTAVVPVEPKGVTKKSKKTQKPISEAKDKIEKVEERKDTGEKADEESSDSEFSFEQGTDEDSTDFSSSGTDEFSTGKQVVELEVDEQTKKNMQEKVAQNRKSVMDIEHTDPRGVIYLGHIPYGMEEPQMKKFFSQFGDVTRVKLWRSKKTGRPRGFAFIEFLDPVVAEIVADSINGYIMFTKMLVCKVVPAEKVTPKMFKGCNRRFVPENIRNHKKTIKDMERGAKDPKKKLETLLKKEEGRKAALKTLGIDYEYSGYQEKTKGL